MQIGVDLGGTNIRIGQVVNGVIVEKKSAKSMSEMNLDESIAYFMQQLHGLVSPHCCSIGIGVPSVVDVDRGVVYNVTNIPAWHEIELKRLVEERFGIPTFINNDANCFALGEGHYGEGKGMKSMIGLTLGTGVGAGIIINHQLYNGNNAGAGEVGDIPYLDGVYEEYCASGFFKRMGTTGRELCEQANRGDEEALKGWSEYGAHLGNLIKTILFAYDPDGIILGGGIANAYPFFIEAVRQSLKSFPYQKSVDNLIIKQTKNPDIAILGAASLGNPYY